MFSYHSLQWAEENHADDYVWPFQEQQTLYILQFDKYIITCKKVLKKGFCVTQRLPNGL